MEDDSVAIVLDPNRIEKDYWHDNPKVGFFRIDFDGGGYGYGIGTYVSDNYVLSNNGAELYDNGVLVVGGERNGNNCFCKLFYPVVSKWILHPARKGDYAWLDQRGYGCDGYCGYSIRYSDPVSFKVELYNSVQN